MLRRRSSSRKELTPKQILSKFFEFLNSSIWAIPVATFIEQKSTTFDRSYGEQAHLEYQTCYREFNSLVTTLIECFCGDVGIELPKFREAIQALSQQRLSRQQRANLEPVAASTDFDIFVPMMMRKNLELQLQALQMIEYLCGVIPQVLLLQDGETLQNRSDLSAEDTERYVLISVMRQSKEEFDEETEKFKRELKLMAQSGEEERHRIEQQVTRESELLDRAIMDKPIKIMPIPDDYVPTPKFFTREETAKALQQWDTDTVEAKPQEAQPLPPPPKRVESATRPRAATVSRTNTAMKKEAEERPVTTTRSTVTVKKEPEEKKTEKRAATAKRRSSVGRGSTTQAVAAIPPVSAAAAASVGEKAAEKTRPQLNDVRRPSLPTKPPSAAPQPRTESPGMGHGPRRKNIHDVNALLRETERLSTADVEARRQYLRQQRDKLLEMKQQEREKQLHEVTTRVAQERPRTAKAARGAMRGGISNADLIARRNLMDKLKTEITEIHPAN